MLSIDISAKLGSFHLEMALELPSGISVISGASGSGKSSLLNCIAGLRKPERGRIVCKQEIFFDSAKSINMPVQKRRCGYLLQRLALFPHMNVAANICFGIDSLPQADQQKRLLELLSLVKLNGLQDRKLKELSGGQLQRVALARALAPNPQLLLLDEPFSNLDPELREELSEELKSLQRQLGIPVLLVTHSRAEAVLLADKIVLVQDGKVCSQQEAGELRSGKPALIDSSTRFSW